VPSFFDVAASKMSFHGFACHFRSLLSIRPKGLLNATIKTRRLSVGKIRLSTPFGTMIY
jgi:uncharacterized protein YigE (DUF2233 family)